MVSNSQDRGQGKGVETLPARPRELEDWLNFHLFHPLARKLALALRNTPVTPNMVSVGGALLVVAAAYAYVAVAWPWGALAGLALHMGWHVFDGADGDLARLTGRSSQSGEVIDGICDYAGNIVLYLAIGAMLQGQIGAWVWWLVVGAGLARIVQTIHYESQRRQYQWWVYGVPWLQVTQSATSSDDGVTGALARGYARFASVLTPNATAVERAMQAADTSRKKFLRYIIRDETQPLLRGISVLSSNYRTIVLGLCMLAQVPLVYFMLELVVLSGVLLWSIGKSRRVTERVLAQAPSSSSR